MNNISMLADKTSLKRMIYYPKEYKDELFTEILKINIKREKILAVVLIAIDALLFLIHTYASKNMGEGLFFFGHFTYLHVLLFLVPVAFLFFSYLGEGWKEIL